MDSLHYTITTPEQVSLLFDQAGIGRRALAQIVDLCILGLVYTLFIIAVVFLSVTNPLHGASPYAAGILLFLSFFIFWGYFIIFEYVLSGQTPGKKLVKIRTVMLDGRRLTFFASCVRNLLRIIDFLPSGYLVGLITMMAGKNERRIGDLAGGTFVVIDVPLWRLRSSDDFTVRAGQSLEAAAFLRDRNLQVRIGQDFPTSWIFQLSEFTKRVKGMSARTREDITERVWNAFIEVPGVDMSPLDSEAPTTVLSTRDKISLLTSVSKFLTKQLKKGDRQ